LFALAGVVPWTFFNTGLTLAANSLVASSNMIKKVYFPRLLIPIASVLSGFVDLAVSLGLVALMMSWYHLSGYPLRLTANLLWLPLFILLAFTASLGASLWLSAWNVEYRDVRHIVPFLLQFWMYATPVVWSTSYLEEPWLTALGLNPMAGVVVGFRWALFGAGTNPAPLIGLSAGVALLVLVSGAFYFRRMERTFADVV
jgi:lipopolysaccharide transport system permease protein